MANKSDLDTNKDQNCPIRLNRIFILDTNILLHDPHAFFSFKGVVIGIPFVVLEELDSFKRGTDERSRNARESIRKLDELRQKGSLLQGVPVQINGQETIIKVFPTPTNVDFSGDLLAAKDNLIIQTAKDLMQQNCTVTLVTKDIDMRVKADVMGIHTEDYTKGLVSYDDFFKGWRRLALPAQDMKTLSVKKIGSIVDPQDLCLNEFIILESENNPENTRLVRYLGGQNFKDIPPITVMNSFHAKNIQQLMTLDLLMDDSIKLVTLLGPAGTGKTFLTLLAGLYKVMIEKAYRKFLVARPVVALGADIGYLPGDLQAKLHYWMQPVQDNLDFILSQIDHEHGDFPGMHEERKRSRHRSKKHDHRGGEQHGQRDRDRNKNKDDHHKPQFMNVDKRIEQLQQRGILSLEAITYMRGRSIPNQFVFIDEVQNLTPHEVKTLVSRAGEGTKVILAGDPYQIDSPYLDFTSNGLTVTSDKLKDNSIVATAFLEKSERSELAKLTTEKL
ncbi:MAG: PhoH family protein [bacterium]